MFYICAKFVGMKRASFFAGILWVLMFTVVLPKQEAFARQVFGVAVNDSAVKSLADSAYYSFIDSNPLLNSKNKQTVKIVEKPHIYVNKTLSFYLLLLLLLLLGVLRMAFPTYFRNLYNAFMSPMGNKRQIREQIEQNVQANIAMNIFFCISLGFFLFAVLISQTKIIAQTSFSPNLVLIAFVSGFAVIYLVKFATLKFVGWVFRIQPMTEAYTYNVLLINKILAILLLPFSVILAYGTGGWLQVILLLSMILIAILLFNRYTRSWGSLGSFFQFSKLHFFLYFCASELLPLAIMIKLAFNWLF